MATAKKDIKAGVTVKISAREYYVEQELENDYVLYSYMSRWSEGKQYSAGRKADLVGHDYELVLPFFKVGEVYSYKSSGADATKYNIKHIDEHGGVRVALAWYKDNYSGQIGWTHFDQSEFNRDLAKV